jgi:zinc protease
LKEVRRITLNNGLTVLITPSQKAKTIALYLGVKSGSADEVESQGAGLSHYLEHMLFKGTAKRPTGQIEEEVRRMGGFTNAYTSYDMTVYYLEVLSQHLDQAVELLSDVAFSSTLPPSEFEKERQVILGEFRMNEDRLMRVVNLELWGLAFPGHPYGHPVIGHVSVFEQVSREDLQDFYKKNYVPQNMVLSLAGHVNPDEAESIIRKHFGSKASKKLQRVPREWGIQQITPRKRLMYREAQHARLVVGFPTVSINHPDSVALDVLSVVLGETESSRLNQVLKEQKQLVFDIGSSSATLQEGGLFTVQSVLLPNKIEETKASLLEQLKFFKTELVDQEVLERVKNQVLARFYQNMETHSSMAHDVLTSEIYTGDHLFSARYTELVRKITPEDVRRVAARYLKDEFINEVVLLPLESKPKEKSNNLAALSREIQHQTLPSGLRLVMIRDLTVPDVILQFVTLGGVRYETDKTNGLSGLVAELLTKGTNKLDQSAVARKIEGWPPTLAAFSGQDSYGMILTVLKPYTADAMKLVSELLNKPAFDANEITKAKELQKQSILAKKEDIFQFSVDVLRKGVFHRHPYRMDPLGTLESVESFDQKDLRMFYEETLDPDTSILSVTGDFEFETMREWAKELDASMDVHVAARGPLKHQKEAILEERRVKASVPREQAMVMQAFNSVSILDSKRYAFEILNNVMGDSAGRLYQKVRGEHGLAYVAGSSLSTGIDPGYLVFYASVDPDKVETAINLIEKEVELLATEGITAVELDSAKKALIGRFERSHEAKASALTQISFGELYGMTVDDIMNYPDFIQKVTLEQVQSVIQDFVTSSRSVKIAVSPKRTKATEALSVVPAGDVPHG